MFDWQDLKHFVVLARTGSLSAAARELGCDHATVGRRVAALEKALGLPLILRLPRSTPLTQDGKVIAGLATDIENQSHAIVRHARSIGETPQIQVRISAPPSIAARVIAPQIAQFHQTFPHITLILSGESAIAELDRGDAEVAVRMVRPQQPDLLVQRIGMMRYALYSTPQHAALPEAARAFIGYDHHYQNQPHQQWLQQLLQGRPVVFQASDLFSLQEAARSGLGAVVLPTFVADGDPDMVTLPTAIAAPTRELWLVTYPDLARSTAVRAVMNFLAEIIGEKCPLAS
ncbi:LysR family transcriptional regulator [Serratia quinivorans]|jgi:DNA-binding transcriptional LysR family regulator|uniref:LysR family transcriptional regulator n=1 Tax=Serratia quinivorans TaxID=137545 RepID=UPI001C494F12|nr:LysR family transcriptional regulator [Serratia quinivorans]MBV6693581.1 LysR family transcriptional regulator [Serratia quinivorans]CAI1131564.1 D-malate degradation protein R [Serratia quinivorans]CAI1889450.1 D-malate degradation protein R [Serratia quinivorans]